MSEKYNNKQEIGHKTRNNIPNKKTSEARYPLTLPYLSLIPPPTSKFLAATPPSSDLNQRIHSVLRMPPSPLSTDEPSSSTSGPTSSLVTVTASDSSLTTKRHHHGPAVLYPILSPVNVSDNFIHAFSGATAGLVSGCITCPLDVIKTKLQAQGGFERPGNGFRRSRGFTGTVRMIWVEEGLKGMYRGLGPIILGYLPTWAVYFTVYEKSKSVLRRTGE